MGSTIGINTMITAVLGVPGDPPGVQRRSSSGLFKTSDDGLLVSKWLSAGILGCADPGRPDQRLL